MNSAIFLYRSANVLNLSHEMSGSFPACSCAGREPGSRDAPVAQPFLHLAMSASCESTFVAAVEEARSALLHIGRAVQLGRPVREESDSLLTIGHSPDADQAWGFGPFLQSD